MLQKLGRRNQGARQAVWAGMGPTVVIIVWWLLLGGAILWVMPERVARASRPPSAVYAGATVRIARSGSPSFAIARDRAGFDAMRLAKAARYEADTAESSASLESINVEDGQTARVLTVDGDAVQIELLDGRHAGERAWIRGTALGPG